MKNMLHCLHDELKTSHFEIINLLMLILFRMNSMDLSKSNVNEAPTLLSEMR